MIIQNNKHTHIHTNMFGIGDHDFCRGPGKGPCGTMRPDLQER